MYPSSWLQGRRRPEPPLSWSRPSASRHSRSAGAGEAADTRAASSGRSLALELSILGAAAIMRACGRSCRSRSPGARAATGCDSSSKQQPQAVTGPAVPWVGARRRSSRSARPPRRLAARPTSRSRARSSSSRGSQGGIALVTIRNTGKRACRLTGRPASASSSAAARFRCSGRSRPRRRTSPRWRIPLEPQRAAAGRGGRGHDHLGELV